MATIVCAGCASSPPLVRGGQPSRVATVLPHVPASAVMACRNTRYSLELTARRGGRAVECGGLVVLVGWCLLTAAKIALKAPA